MITEYQLELASKKIMRGARLVSLYRSHRAYYEILKKDKHMEQARATMKVVLNDYERLIEDITKGEKEND